MISIHIERSPHQLVADEVAFNALSSGVPFRQSSWLSAWIDQFNDPDRQLWLSARSSENELCGVLALQRPAKSDPDSRGFPICLTSRASQWQTIAGDDVCSDHLSILYAPGRQAAVVKRFADFLVKHCRDSELGWNQLRLGGLVAGDVAMRTFFEHLRSRGAHVALKSRMSVWFRKCDVDWPTYLSNCSKRLRYHQRRLIRHFDEPSHHLSLQFADTPEDVKRSIDELIRIHQAHWQSKGHSGTYADARMVRFIHQVAQDSLRRGRLLLPALMRRNGSNGQNEMIAAQINLIGDDDRHYCFSTCADYRYENLRPGLMLNTLVIRYLHQQQSPGIDWLRGDEIYKCRFAATPVPLLQADVFAPSIYGQLQSLGEHLGFRLIQQARRLRHRPLVKTLSLDEAYSERWSDLLPQASASSENVEMTAEDASTPKTLVMSPGWNAALDLGPSMPTQS